MNQASEYMKLYNQLKEAITTGSYSYLDKLPSKRTLANDHEVSVITVQHAYSLLADEGYIEARERSGYFVIYKEGDFIGTNNPLSSPPKNIEYPPHQERGEFSANILSKTVRKVLLDYNDRLLVKSPNQGCLELRSEIKSYLARSRGIHVDTDQIVIGSGAEYLYSLVAQLFDKNSLIAIESPGYSIIEKVYTSMGHRIERLPIGQDGISSQDLKEAKATLLHVTPFHSFPSNVSIGISKKKEYLRWASEGKVIIEDNYDSELSISTKMEESLFSLAKDQNVIYINTFSKTIAPSMRLGYMLLPKSLTKDFQEKLGFYSCTVPVLDQLVISELLKNGDFERHINRQRRLLRKDKKRSLS